jgi:hypothetical protein
MATLTKGFFVGPGLFIQLQKIGSFHGSVEFFQGDASVDRRLFGQTTTEPEINYPLVI